jgi:hypothetical protein
LTRYHWLAKSGSVKLMVDILSPLETGARRRAGHALGSGENAGKV